MKKIIIYTDGACSGNPGAGGWAAILEYNRTQKEISGGEKITTNNRMELTAVISALSILKEPCEVELFSDSKYLIDSIEKGWVLKWKAKDWKRAGNKLALNIDLWERILKLIDIHKVNFHWVKGHSENPKNEKCDKIAVKMSNEFK